MAEKGRDIKAMGPYSVANLTRAVADAKACIDRGKADLIADMCCDLLPELGQSDVDRALGMMLKLLLRHASAEKIAEVEAKVFSLDQMRSGWNPQDASISYLLWKYRQAFGPERDPDLEQAREFVAAGQALWHYLDEPTRLLHGLHVKLAAAYAALGNVESLRELGEALVAGTLSDERQQTALLRVVKLLQRIHADDDIAYLIDRLLAPSEPHAAGLEIALTAISVLSKSAQRLSDHRRLSQLLARLVPWLQRSGKGLCDGRLVKALLRCAEFNRLHELLPHLIDNVENNDVRATLLSALEQLCRYDMLGEAGEYIERAYRQDPSDPIGALLFGRFLLQRGVSHTQIEPVFESIKPDATGYDEAVLWMAQLYYVEAKYEQVVRWVDAHPLNDPERIRTLLTRVQEAIERPLFPSHHGIGPADRARLSLHQLGPAGTMLEPLVQKLNGEISHTGGSDAEEFRGRLQDVVHTVEQSTQDSLTLKPNECLNAARDLVRAATIHLRDIVEQQRGTPDILGPQYGTLDVSRVIELFEALHRVAIRLSQFGIESALRDEPLVDMRHLCQLAELHVQSAFTLNETQTSERLLQVLRDRQVASAFILRLQERCALQRGDIRGAAEAVAGQPGTSGELFRLEPFEQWIQAEAVESRVLVNQEIWEGSFEYIDSEGHLHQAPHQVPATRVDLGKVPGLRVRDTELLIGPNRSIPRPHPWHFRDIYGYPRPSSIRLNHGYRACRLRPAIEHLHVREPVVVLANMDGPLWHNYYHWMLPILTRIAVLLDQGVFEHRRLLVPAELSDWMTFSLELLGLPAGRMLRYTAEQEVLVDDAWVVGPVEFSAAPLLKSLQRRLWAAAGVDPHGGRSGHAVWLSRRRQHRRYLANSDAIEEMVQRVGFEVVVPESLSLLDQVRVCGDATVVAGPAGANLTNLIFARPGTQVLGLVGENNNYPTFIDLCAVLNLPQRWIFGRMDPRKSWWGTYHEPFEIDMTLLEQELQRLVATQ